MKIQLSTIPLLILCQAIPSAIASNHEALADRKSRSTQRVNNDTIQPKMNGSIPGTERTSKTPFRGRNRLSEKIKSKVAYFIGTCSSDVPFQFSVGGRSGRGAVGLPSDFNTEDMSLSYVEATEGGGRGDITLKDDKVETNFFAALSLPKEGLSSSMYGVPFEYSKRKSKALSTVELLCPGQEDPMDIIVIVGDNERKYAKAKVSWRHGNEDIDIQLLEEKSTNDLQAAPMEGMLMTESLLEEGQEDLGEEELLMTIKGNTEKITLKNSKKRLRRIRRKRRSSRQKASAACSLVQMTLLDSNDQEVPKTLIVCDDDEENEESVRRRRLLSDDKNVKVENADIDENGDIAFNFASLHSREAEDGEEESVFLKFDARIGINSECKDETIEVVDMNAMLPSSKPTMVVNGGWFRRARELHGISDDCQWEPVVIDAIVSDPHSRYSHIAHLPTPVEVQVINGLPTKNSGNRKLTSDELDNRRRLLTARASSDEMNVTEEMTMGRKPENILPSEGGAEGGRNLSSSSHKKILVHGYCSTADTFPPSHFTSAIEFSDPDTTNPSASSWSNDLFARKINSFARKNNISGCGIIAHSQGGLAALHLYKSYWSCLDDGSLGGSRMIQSVGSPYQGSALAGDLAAIGDIFGTGCGYNHDITESGATNWLRTIPSWARSKVHYYTTSFKDNWWSWDYCNIATDLILNDPDDGAIEKGRGQLSGGNNRGHKTGWCHTTGMDEPAQYRDYNRNREMNSNARY